LVARRRPVALKNKEPRKIGLESVYSSRSVVNVFIHRYTERDRQE
jgi:hypothetical protein